MQRRGLVVCLEASPCLKPVGDRAKASQGVATPKHVPTHIGTLKEIGHHHSTVGTLPDIDMNGKDVLIYLYGGHAHLTNSLISAYGGKKHC